MCLHLQRVFVCIVQRGISRNNYNANVCELNSIGYDHLKIKLLWFQSCKIVRIKLILYKIHNSVIDD